MALSPIRWPAPRSAYIHVPFCRHRCGYCNFSVVAGREDLTSRFLSAIDRELSQLDDIAEKARRLQSVEAELGEATALMEDAETDAELRKLAEEERLALTEKVRELEQELRLLLLPRDIADDRAAILQAGPAPASRWRAAAPCPVGHPAAW